MSLYKRNICTVLFLVYCAVSTPSVAGELPIMFFSDPVFFVKNFPLGKISHRSMSDTYGHPKMVTNALTKDNEIWIYYRKSQVYTFYFDGGYIVDVKIKDTKTAKTLSMGTASAKQIQHNAQRPD